MPNTQQTKRKSIKSYSYIPSQRLHCPALRRVKSKFLALPFHKREKKNSQRSGKRLAYLSVQAGNLCSGSHNRTDDDKEDHETEQGVCGRFQALLRCNKSEEFLEFFLSIRLLSKRFSSQPNRISRRHGPPSNCPRGQVATLVGTLDPVFPV
jgi:hypothetical protein